MNASPGDLRSSIAQDQTRDYQNHSLPPLISEGKRGQRKIGGRCMFPAVEVKGNAIGNVLHLLGTGGVYLDTVHRLGGRISIRKTLRDILISDA